MAQVRSKDTMPEMALRKALFALGFRYRLHVQGLPGKPDLVFAQHKAIIFVNGCFWHWHGCRRSRLPSGNATYWQAKITKNQERDRINHAALLAEGWRVLIVWECALNAKMCKEAARRAGLWLTKHSATTKYCQIEPTASEEHSTHRLRLSSLLATA